MQALTLHTPTSSLTLFPKRGAIITSLKFGNEELLFQDMLAETLFDTTKSVRGGIPILFPNSGPLTAQEQKTIGLALPQHGFMRNISDFEMMQESENSLTLRYENFSQNSPSFPYDFIFEYKIILKENSLELTTKITNSGEKEMPIAPGFHPYFPFSQEETISLFSKNNDWSSEIMSQKDFWKSGETLSLDISGEKNISVKIGKLSFSYELDENFTRMMIWSLPQKNFVCIEPVFGEDGMIAKNPKIVKARETFEYQINIFDNKV